MPIFGNAIFQGKEKVWEAFYVNVHAAVMWLVSIGASVGVICITLGR